MIRKKQYNDTLIAYIFLAPAALFMLIFCVYPIIYNISVAMTDMSIMNFRNHTYSFVGFQQYVDLLKDPSGMFAIAFKNTLFYTVASIVFQFLIGFMFALLLAKRFPLSGFMRGFLMLAWLIPHTVTGLLGKYLFAEAGLVNDVLKSLGIIDSGQAWLVDKRYAMSCVIIMNIWIGIPYNMMLLSTGLTTIPETVYESAAIDGVNTRQRLFHITIPMLKPTILTVLTLGFINTFKVFDLVYVMTGGGPVHSSEVLSSLSYQYAFNSSFFSKGSATANILFLILFLLSLLYQKLIRNETGELS